MSHAGPDQADPGLLTSSATVVRLLVGWSGTAIGILNLSMGIDSGPYLIFHALLLVTGVLLLVVDRLIGSERPDWIAYLAGGATTLVGLVVSAVPASSSVCCMRDLAVRHGFPFAVWGRDPGGWQFSFGHAIADLIFWACAGLIVGVLVTILRPARRPPAGDPPRRHPTHAGEPPATRERTAEDEIVGGLP